WHILHKYADALNILYMRDKDLEDDLMLCIDQTLFCPHLLRAFVQVQVQTIPAKYVLRRYMMKAKSDMTFDRRDRKTVGPNGVQKCYRTKMLMVEAMAVAKEGSKSKVAFEQAIRILKG
ncbi:hypothetical protein E2562_035233, partial [Oryza meyeriana var. granulata]